MNAAELRGGTHFLLLHRLPNGNGCEVETVAKFEDVGSKWRDASRVSPIFSINGAPVPILPKKGRRWILFFGPFFPGLLDLTGLPTAYLSLGILNVILISKDSKERKRALDFAQKSSCVWEEWEVRNGVLSSTQSKPSKVDKKLFPKAFGDALSIESSQMLAASREYLLLIKSAYARAKTFIPDYARELEDFDIVIRATISNPKIESGYKHSLIVNANAYLSRQTEQTYAGTPPIVANDSHLWTHSLLGVGIGSLALIRIRQFASRAFTKSALIARIESLENRDPQETPLYHLEAGDRFWQTDHLA
jgi:hypothetical protein